MALAFIEQGTEPGKKESLALAFRLSLPAMIAESASVIEQYIDSSMLGHIGSVPAAAVGLVSSSIWMTYGVAMSLVTGFTVQVAQRLGAGEKEKARSVMVQGILSCLAFSFVILAAGAAISPSLPVWLGGGEEIREAASAYFLVAMLCQPLSLLNYTATGMLQAEGNMRLPGVLNTSRCFLDILFNFLCIFPSRVWHGIPIPGLGLGPAGAALGTGLADGACALPLLLYLLFGSRDLRLRRGERLRWDGRTERRAFRLAVPLALQQSAVSGASVATTRIVSPMGTVALAANSFSVVAESVCYMPSFGIQSAASALSGQCVGAGRKGTAKKFAWLTAGLAMAIQGGLGVFLWFFCPGMISLLTADAAVIALSVKVLRIEAFAEPFYGASIAVTGSLNGAGDTLGAFLLALVSLWAVRVPLSLLLGPRMGLEGIWIAMAVELTFRGTVFLARLASGRWLKQDNVLR